jgi:cytochrome P450
VFLNADPRFETGPIPIKHNSYLAEDVWRTLRDGELFALDIADEARLKKLVLPFFAREKIDLVRSSIIEVVDRTLAQLPSRFDLLADYCNKVAIRVMAKLLGVTDNLVPALVRFTQGYRDLFEREEWYPADEFYRRTAHVHIGLALFKKIVTERRGAQRKEFLIDLALDYRYQNDRLSDEELISLMSFLVGPGLESIAQLTAAAVHNITADRRNSKLLHKNPLLWPGAIRETLRYDYCVKLGIAKYARADCTLDGITIAKGDRVFAIVAAAQRDPAVFHDPDRFDITRPTESLIAFGKDDPTGMVKYLALQVAEIAAQRLLRNFPSLTVLGLPSYDPNHRALRAMTSLPMLAIR